MGRGEIPVLPRQGGGLALVGLSGLSIPMPWCKNRGRPFIPRVLLELAIGHWRGHRAHWWLRVQSSASLRCPARRTDGAFPPDRLGGRDLELTRLLVIAL
jgi:hypothetical protein